MADRERKLPNTLDTKFRLGSMNKMITALATMQLVQAGKLSLTEPFGKYVTDYPNKTVASKVTIDHLLTHRGGTGDIFGPQFAAHRLELRTLEDYVRLYGRRDLEFEPGGRWQYSNYGYVLLGVLIERVTKQSYYDYVRKHIYEPAGMKGTDSLPEEVVVPGRSMGYTKPSGASAWTLNTETLPYRGMSAGGGYSTAADLLRFGEALRNHRLLDSAHTKILIDSKVEHAPGRGYADGFMDTRHDEATRWVGHGGGAPGMSTEFRLYPQLGYVVVVLANVDPMISGHLAEYLDARLPAPPR